MATGGFNVWLLVADWWLAGWHHMVTPLTGGRLVGYWWHAGGSTGGMLVAAGGLLVAAGWHARVERGNITRFIAPSQRHVIIISSPLTVALHPCLLDISPYSFVFFGSCD